MSKVDFKVIKELYLSNNKISNITVFQNVIFPNLRLLSLKENQILNINVLTKVDNNNFPKLQKILLDNNKISDINELSKIKLENLKTITLSNNKIDKQKYSLLISNIGDKIII